MDAMGDPVLYTKRYHEDAAPSAPAQGSGAAEGLSQTLRERMQACKAQVVLDGPDGPVQAGKALLELAVCLSEGYQLDLDIIQKTYGYDVVFHLLAGPYGETVCQAFACLLSQSDCFDLSLCKTQSNDASLCLSFYTHRDYVSGRDGGAL